MAELTYAAVIVTRNRPDALALCLPLLLAQSRPPSQTLIIDSSDDATENIETAKRVSKDFCCEVSHHRAPKGMTVQRNIGLSMVEHPVVLFPDDDSLLLPGAMAEIMSVYEQDQEGLVGGVCAAEAMIPPDGTLDKARYREKQGDSLRRKIATFRFKLERLLAPEPFLRAAHLKYASLQQPGWLEPNRHVLVEFMTGFRMSFRTPLIRAKRFDEDLGAYALFEDTDASLKILESHVLVGARHAQIFHYKSPARRDRGFTMGMMQILNRAYVIAKNVDADPRLQRQFTIYARYKCLQYLAGHIVSRSNYTKARLEGARAAVGPAKALFDLPLSAVPEAYLNTREQLEAQGNIHN